MCPTIEINDGSPQLIGSAEQVTQNNYYAQPAPADAQAAPKRVVILGAGVDAALGLPATNSLIPRIAEWLATDEGMSIDKALRAKLKRLQFKYDTLIEKKIDHLIRDLDQERETIVRHISQELEQNNQLDERDQKMGNVIVSLLQRINNLKSNAAIDEETERNIMELFNIEMPDPNIIDFSKISYTENFKNIIKEILKRSMNDADNPVLRHVYKHILDIEKLLRDHFYGFYTGDASEIKTYLYIAWTLWAYLVHEEQSLHRRHEENGGPLPVYGQLQGKDVQVVSFNYTTMAAAAVPAAFYFNGRLTEYVDVENKNEEHLDDVTNLDLADFFQNRLAGQMSLEKEYKALPTPTFMPPLKLKPVLSKHYIRTWYQTYEAVRQASHILILGHSLQAADGFFCDLLRDNRTAEIVIVNRDLDTTCRHLCTLLQQDPRHYSSTTPQGRPARRYDNRITVIGADLREIDLTEWLR